MNFKGTYQDPKPYQGGGPQMEVKWTKISMKQDFEGNVVVTYENDEMILEITEGTMLVGGNLE